MQTLQHVNGAITYLRRSISSDKLLQCIDISPHCCRGLDRVCPEASKYASHVIGQDGAAALSRQPAV